MIPDFRLVHTPSPVPQPIINHAKPRHEYNVVGELTMNGPKNDTEVTP
jgi:hypothetical protein